ncbi:MAG: twin-arginine translocation signal domain-containing protein [Candidatus Fermentibacteraceae bacterium]
MDRRRFLRRAAAGLAGLAGLGALWPLRTGGEDPGREGRLSRRRARHYRKLAG